MSNRNESKSRLNIYRKSKPIGDMLYIPTFFNGESSTKSFVDGKYNLKGRIGNGLKVTFLMMTWCHVCKKI